MRTWITLLILAFTLAARAQYQRNVKVEWEPIEGAAFYEVEWRKAPEDPNVPPLSVQVSTHTWAGPMEPGVYQMRIRALDARKAPGDWSASEEFKVGLDPVSGQSPKDGEVVKTNQAEKAPVKFLWQAVPGSQKYLFELSTEDGAISEFHETTQPELTLTLPVAKKYTWFVKGQASESIASETAAMLSFTLEGRQIPRPDIEQRDNFDSLQWNKPPGAETFDYSLQRLDPTTGTWETLASETKSTSQSLRLRPEWVGGQFLFEVRAHGELRPSSEMSTARFRVEDLKESMYKERDAFQLQKKWERREGWFASARQQMSMIEYSASNVDWNQTANFKTIAGTGRLGVGYYSQGYWGWTGTAELGGLYLDGRTYTTNAFELTVIHRRTLDVFETRHYFGIFSKELPLLTSDDFMTHDVDRASSLGPHYGYEKDWNWSSRTGVQTQFHASLNLIRLRTPNGQDLAPSASWQAAALGFYKLTSTATGYYGYAYRYDSIAYGANIAISTNNSIRISGHYLNFFLEWGL